MRFKIVVLCLILVVLLSFVSCGKQDNSATDNLASTEEENLPEYTNMIPETKESTQTDSDAKMKNSEKEAEFSGLDVQKSTEITLEEGQDFEIFD